MACSTIGLGQNNYKHARITLLKGEVMNVIDISLNEETVSFIIDNETARKKMNVSYDLNRVQKIEVADNKNNFLSGLFVGAGLGVIPMLIIKNNYEKPVTVSTVTYSTNTTSWHTYTTTKTMGVAQIGLIISGGALVGGIIGSTIKRGWKTVFPKSISKMDKVDLNLTLNDRYKNGAVSFNYKF